MSSAGRPPGDWPAVGLLGVKHGELRVGLVFVHGEDLSMALPHQHPWWPILVEPRQPSGRGTWDMRAPSRDWPSDMGCLVMSHVKLCCRGKRAIYSFICPRLMDRARKRNKIIVHTRFDETFWRPEVRLNLCMQAYLDHAYSFP